MAAEQLSPLINCEIEIVEGNTKIGKERLQYQKVLDIFSWGKHLVFQFDSFAMRTHFMLFGTFEADIEGKSVTGDYKRTQAPRLILQFSNGTIRFYNCSLRYIESAHAKEDYDFSIDVMSPLFDPKHALKQLEENPTEQIGDLLLDQGIFAGVGNIIKNEVLFLEKLGPETLAQDIPMKRKKKLIETVLKYVMQFYEWRRGFVLRKHFQIYRKSECPRCHGKVLRKKTGKKARLSYFCPICQ